MTDMWRLLMMLGLAGTAVTFLGSLALWWHNDERRIRRALRNVLQSEPESMIVAHGRGRGGGFSFASGLIAVAWDRGDWCLVYRIDEVIGAELIIDGQVVARAFRGEPRRALEQVVSSADQVTLRLLFDDPKSPDFELDLWLRGDEARRDDWSPRAAIGEANRWLARVEAIVRRPARPQAPVVATPPPVTRIAEAQPRAKPRQPVAPPVDDEAPPWDGDPEFDFGPDDDEESDRRHDN
ncbi:MAG: hypothetical protein Q8J89_16835 [Caulobacter sp.]|nr:hypothetical protein [Caulobacter sp.]